VFFARIIIQSVASKCFMPIKSKCTTMNPIMENKKVNKMASSQPPLGPLDKKVVH
jgi:hypothetical protein